MALRNQHIDGVSLVGALKVQMCYPLKDVNPKRHINILSFDPEREQMSSSWHKDTNFSLNPSINRRPGKKIFAKSFQGLSEWKNAATASDFL